MALKFEKLHVALIITSVLLLVLAIGIFRAPITGYLIQQNTTTPLNLRIGVPSVCILNVNYTNPTSATYYYQSNAQIPPGQDTDEIGINITNAGNVNHSVRINASIWAGPAGTGIACNQTVYLNTSGAWSGGTPACFGSTAMGLGRQGADVYNITYLRARIPAATTAGGYNQNITITTE